MAYHARTKKDYSKQDLQLTFTEVDQYLDLRQDRLSTNQDRIETLLIGSAYIPAVASSRHELKDIDLYLNDEETFQSLENLPNARKSRTSKDVLHMSPSHDWCRDLKIEFFNSLERPLDLENGEYIDRALDHELDNPYQNIYSGDILEVYLPSPGSYAATKQAEDIDMAEKYEGQLSLIDNATGTQLNDNFSYYSTTNPAD